jgi:iron-sulfur cluster repair protein YtfE (RIC family)
MDEIDALASRFEKRAEAGTAEGLRSRGLRLYALMAIHLTREDDLLVPILREEGPEGVARADQLAREHRSQRELLEFLTDQLGRRPLPSLLVIRQLRNFTGYVRFDMIHEERTLLT